MQKEHEEFKRIEYLRSRVAEIYSSNPSSYELGNVALELLAIRNDLESKSFLTSRIFRESLKYIL